MNKILKISAMVALAFATACQNENDIVAPEEGFTADNQLVNEGIPKVVKTFGDEQLELGLLPNGDLLFNGDMAVTEEWLTQYIKDKGEVPKTEANLGSRLRPWTNKRVFFLFEPSFTYKKLMRQAMRSITKDTGVQFVKGKGRGNYVRIFNGSGNYSYVGMIGRAQDLSLQSNSLGVAIHELGHAVGLMHEHQRTDRDDFLIVHPDYVNNSQYTKSGETFGQFDINSIMLYGSQRLGNGEYTMVRKRTGKPFSSNIGKRRLGFGDRAALKAVYK